MFQIIESFAELGFLSLVKSCKIKNKYLWHFVIDLRNKLLTAFIDIQYFLLSVL